MTTKAHHELKFTPLSLKDDIGDNKNQMLKLGAALKKLKSTEEEIASIRIKFGDIAYREYMTETSLQKNSNYGMDILGEFGKRFKEMGESKLPKANTKEQKKKSTKGNITGGDILAFAAENIEKGYCPEVIFYPQKGSNLLIDEIDSDQTETI